MMENTTPIEPRPRTQNKEDKKAVVRMELHHVPFMLCPKDSHRTKHMKQIQHLSILWNENNRDMDNNATTSYIHPTACVIAAFRATNQP